MKILVASPQGWATEALCGLLAKLDSGCEVEVVHDIPSLLSLPPATPSGTPDLVLVDVDAASADSSAAIRGFLRKFPGARILALGSRLDDAYVEQALDAGALGYLPKSYSETVILGVLQLVLGGATYRPGSPGPANSADTVAAGAPVPAGKPEEIAREFGLSARQLEVLSLVGQGKPNQAIAKQLGITEGVVKLHMGAIFKALNVKNRSEAALVASRMSSVNLRQIREAESGKLDLDWLLPHMTHRRLRKDSIVFRKGDQSRELYYLQRGGIRLEEIHSEIASGTLFGEIGIFSPTHERTCTAVCATDVDLFTLTDTQVKRLYFLNPQFAMYVVHLIATHYSADRSREI
ncbi:MAG: LuxR C-terminal-related transcriptional regulator [Pseudomonadota bacterium]